MYAINVCGYAMHLITYTIVHSYLHIELTYLTYLEDTTVCTISCKKKMYLYFVMYQHMLVALREHITLAALMG